MVSKCPDETLGMRGMNLNLCFCVCWKTPFRFLAASFNMLVLETNYFLTGTCIGKMVRRFLSSNVRKCTFWHVRPTKLAWASKAVWSVFSIRVEKLCTCGCPKCSGWSECKCAGWSKTSLCAHIRNEVFSRCGSSLKGYWAAQRKAVSSSTRKCTDSSENSPDVCSKYHPGICSPL